MTNVDGDYIDTFHDLNYRAVELAAFAGIAVESINAMLPRAQLICEALWVKADPQTEAQRNEWYKNTWEYLLDQTYYNATHQKVVLRNQFCLDNTGQKVLDFGGGIGDLSLLLATTGRNVTYVDLDGTAAEFFEYRLKKSGFAPQVTVIKTDGEVKLGVDAFDTICCFDVLEHMEDVAALVGSFFNALRETGALLCDAAFGSTEHLPMHLEKNVHWKDELYTFLEQLFSVKREGRFFTARKGSPDAECDTSHRWFTGAVC